MTLSIFLQAGRCAYATLIMAAYWCTEAIPIAVTALLPFALMPWLGIISAKDIAENYLKVSSLVNILNKAVTAMGMASVHQ